MEVNEKLAVLRYPRDMTLRPLPPLLFFYDCWADSWLHLARWLAVWHIREVMLPCSCGVAHMVRLPGYDRARSVFTKTDVEGAYGLV